MLGGGPIQNAWYGSIKQPERASFLLTPWSEIRTRGMQVVLNKHDPKWQVTSDKWRTVIGLACIPLEIYKIPKIFVWMQRLARCLQQSLLLVLRHVGDWVEDLGGERFSRLSPSRPPRSAELFVLLLALVSIVLCECESWIVITIC